MLRLLEFLLIFAGGPLLMLALRQPLVLFASLWAGAGLAYAATRRQRPAEHDPRQELRAVFTRFAIIAPAITAATWLLWPESFLSMPRERPVLWAAVMVLYPLLSVWPQEMLFRGFLFTRYAPVFATGRAKIAASALAFGFAHIIFMNAIAVIMTTIGGFLFARDYARHRSLRLTCLEHALYGCLIFTVGLGRFFYTGAAWHQHP